MISSWAAVGPSHEQNRYRCYKKIAWISMEGCADVSVSFISSIDVLHRGLRMRYRGLALGYGVSTMVDALRTMNSKNMSQHPLVYLMPSVME
jgi:hypothetical protein